MCIFCTHGGFPHKIAHLDEHFLPFPAHSDEQFACCCSISLAIHTQASASLITQVNQVHNGLHHIVCHLNRETNTYDFLAEVPSYETLKD